MDQRKLKILNSIIKSYTESKEPVGSRTLSKDENIGVSAATIRNEMSDLEDLGYLVKVHSSSGRMPSNKGYRLYVDALLSDEIPFKASTNELFDSGRLEKSNELDSIMSNATKILSAITNYTAVSVLPSLDDIYLKYINVVMLSPKDLVMIYIYNSKTVRHDVIRLKSPVNFEKITLLNSILNSSLIDKNPSDILQALHSTMFNILRRENQALDYVIPHIEEEVLKMTEASIKFEGLGNIYNYNDLNFDENQKLIERFKDDNPLKDLLKSDKGQNLQIYIGEELEIEGFENFSIITMNFENPDGVKGKLGVIGPTAMEYDKVISDLLIVTRYISKSI